MNTVCNSISKYIVEKVILMKIEVKDRMIERVEMDDLEVEFEDPPAIEELDDVERFISFFTRHRPRFSGDSLGWTVDDFEDFMQSRSDAAEAFLQVLTSNEDEWVSINDVLDGMSKIVGIKYTSIKLRGVLMAFNKSVHHSGKPELFDRKYEDDDLFYKLGERFGEILREYFKDELQS